MYSSGSPEFEWENILYYTYKDPHWFDHHYTLDTHTQTPNKSDVQRNSKIKCCSSRFNTQVHGFTRLPYRNITQMAVANCICGPPLFTSTCCMSVCVSVWICVNMCAYVLESSIEVNTKVIWLVLTGIPRCCCCWFSCIRVLMISLSLTEMVPNVNCWCCCCCRCVHILMGVCAYICVCNDMILNTRSHVTFVEFKQNG